MAEKGGESVADADGTRLMRGEVGWLVLYTLMCLINALAFPEQGMAQSST